MDYSIGNSRPDTPTENYYILVVDDEGAIRYSVSKTLQRVGYHVSEAESGEKALEMLVQQEFDVILTDIRMPGIDGVELLRRIKEIAPDSSVILMTSITWRVCAAASPTWSTAPPSPSASTPDT